MKKPWYQKLTASYIPWIFVGFLFVGTFLDAISNALQFITPTVSCCGSLIILSIVFFFGFRIRKHPIVWITEDNQQIYIKSFGPKPILVLTGILVALWLPRFIGNDQGESRVTEPLDPTQNRVYSTPTESSVVTGTSAILGNDLKDEILSFYPTDIRDSLELNSANLDAYAREEIIVTRSTDLDFTRPPGFFIDIFAYISDNERWQKILHVEDETCPLSFGIIDLKKDTSRQVVIYQECGTGSIVRVQIYQYKGLQFVEKMGFTTPNDQNEFPNSVVDIINEELYIHSYVENFIYHFVWDGSALIVDKFDLVLPPNTAKVFYWRDEGKIVFEPASLEVELGTFVYFVHDEAKDTDFCAGDMYVGRELFSFTEFPNLIATHKQGTDTISMLCKWQPASGVITISVK